MNNLPYSVTELKRSSIHFITGKVTSGLLTVGTLLWLVRLLEIEAYGVYVTLQAGMAFMLAITSFGLPWVASRFLPEFRLSANGMQLASLVWKVIGLGSLFVICGALLLLISLSWLLDYQGLTDQVDVVRVYLLVFVLEGVRGNIQDCILDPLLQQKQAQLVLILRNFVFLLSLVLILLVQDKAILIDVVLAELMATFLGMVLSLWFTVRYLHEHLNLTGKKDWRPPGWHEMWLTGRDMYLSYLITLSYSSSIFVFFVNRFLGVETTALFGFLISLYGQVFRYLPSTLLFGLIRPKLMVSYLGEGSMLQLMSNANLAGKISLFVLLPILICVWLTGSGLVNLISGEKFTQAGFYLGGILLVLIPLSQRQILETVAVASGHGQLCIRCNVFGISSIPLAYWFFINGLGLWSVILAMIWSQIIFNATLTIAMKFAASYRPDFVGFFKLVVAALISFMLTILAKLTWEVLFQIRETGFVEFVLNIQDSIPLLLIQQISVPLKNWFAFDVTAIFACGFFLLISYFLKPFRVEERARLNNVFNCNYFVW
jgi:O-antigen/teichoic acid export membrane protein